MQFARCVPHLLLSVQTVGWSDQKQKPEGFHLQNLVPHLQILFIHM